jgi:putative transposase
LASWSIPSKVMDSTHFWRSLPGSDQTYFNWKSKYDGLLPTEMRRSKQLEEENAKLRKVVADLSRGKEMLQDVIRRKL